MDNSEHFNLVYGELFAKKKPAPNKSSLGKRPLFTERDAAPQRAPTKQAPSAKAKEPKITEANKRAVKVYRKIGDNEWVDESLADWPDNDFRIYCCNLGNEVSEDILASAFRKYASFAKCKIIKDKKTDKSRGYGFVSILDGEDYRRAMREMSGKYVGNRPITLKPSKWTDKSFNKGCGLIKQGNDASVPKLAPGAKAITSYGGEASESTTVSLAKKYAHLIGQENVAKVEKLIESKRQKKE